MTEPEVLAFPLTGRWLARNSPARRIPSHGSHLMGTTYSIDLIGVDGRGRAATRGWASAFGTEPPEKFLGFGRPVLAPVDGTVVVAHDGEEDHAARRSPLTLIPYLLSQRSRLREGGITAITGNYVIIDAGFCGPYVTLVHLRRGSLQVESGQRIQVGQQIGECGNSGNSTQPHLHVQVTDSADWETCRGLPMLFRFGDGSVGMPDEGEIVSQW
ncbi:M23 family metallopeptidase [Corynebacterium comes]|uniref:Peptidase n=1 Tax=Corynebacterium comes TaxID=2675218 RepID=A0A6B8VYS8_9CORY|nr:M23 family metallopeptidase [Corynebacterium comes]QGU04857.1 putative peptidase [Corynebacterium comes]